MHRTNLVIALMGLWGFGAGAVELVRDGKAVASIVVPAQALAVESYAARELQYHIERATGAKLPIVPEGVETGAKPRVYLGKCVAAANIHLDPSSLPGNSYIVKSVGGDLYIVGQDGHGDPLNRDTHEGTLFGVYDILEDDMQVRWLWPGQLGEVIPHRDNLALAPAEGIVQPRLWFKEWRGGSSEGERIWLKRQRFGRSIQPQYGHSFGKYWERFGQTHPEYFTMLPDGTRRMDPTGDGEAEYVHMCVSEPGLARQIIADWRERGAPEFLNVCENDGWAGCACPTCLSWDEPDPDNPVPFDKRLEAAQRAFAGHEGRRDEWMLRLGSLSDRFARFWERVSEEAVKIRPDVKVVSYVYDNYRKPPVKAMLNSNVLCGLVPHESIFGFSKLDSDMFRHDWSGWEKTGCQLFLRPNYTLQAPNFPGNYARTLGEDLKFAMAHGLKGTDFDSLTGKYATQGPSLYMLAKILNHPGASVDAVIDEFCAAFGPASPSVKEYFDLWESIYPHFSETEQASCIASKRKYGAGLYGPYYILAPALYTPQVMSHASAILDKAQKEAAGDPAASARIEWLAKGLKQAELMLATERAYEKGVDTGEKSEFLAAYQSLREFRQSNLDYDKTNFIGLGGEERTWAKAGR
ncbi:MAG TPA: DUF4838 domain-containing protein [Verrucomicrobiae bacterium]|nr:DUF4838 domain-containing protein [Verrucomicrobiae bacterium]